MFEDHCSGAVETKLIAAHGPAFWSQCHSKPNEFKMECFLPPPREITFDGPFCLIDTLGFPSPRLLRELGLCLFLDHFPQYPLILQASSSFISLHSFPFPLPRLSSSLSPHHLLHYSNHLLTAVFPPISPLLSLGTMLPHSPFQTSSLILSLPPKAQ